MDRRVELRAVGTARQPPLADLDVLGARSLRPLALFKRHALPFAQVVEPRAGTGAVEAPAFDHSATSPALVGTIDFSRKPPQRRALKKSCISARHSSSRMPETISKR